MPRVEITLSTGDTERIRNMEAGNAADLIDEFQDGKSPVLSLTSELGIVHMARRHIVSIFVEAD